MIFATVGTTELSFNRLIKAFDDLAKVSSETFAIQIGHSTLEPQYAQWFRFDTNKSMQDWIARADVVITHGGFGIISDCLRAKKRIVACPRRFEYGEAVNPQKELVVYLAQQGLLVALEEISHLAFSIEKARRMKTDERVFESNIPSIVAAFVQGLTNDARNSL